MARWLEWTFLSLCLLTVLLAVAAPLIVRGPVLARLVEHESKDLCGTARVTGGHVSLGVTPALLFQRPFDVVLTGTRIREPDGNDFFRAETVRARLAVHRHPWRVVVERVLVADGKWRLFAREEAQLTAALRKVPPGGRDACEVRAPPEAPPPGGPTGPVLTVQAVTLERMLIDLSFPSWAVALDGVDAHGTVEVRNAREGTQFLFDARDVIARKGGTLRVGPRRDVTPVLPFDRVEIPRVAVTADAPPDLVLTVSEARTANANLTGHARFTNVFAPDEWNVSPGMKLEARWTDIGVPLARNAAWAGLGEGLAQQRADLHANLHGTFDALVGAATIAGRALSLRADLLPDARYKLDVRLDDLDTTPFVPAERRALLAGRLNGHLALSAHIGESSADTAASLDAIELALQRTHAGHKSGGIPVRWVVSNSFRPRSPDELRLDLGKVAYARDGLTIDAFRIAAPSLAVAGRARAEPRPGSRDLLVRLWSQPGARFDWQGETFLPPPVLSARVEPGRAITVEPFTVKHGGGGAISAGGTLRFNGRADLKLALRAYPLGHLPIVGDARPPGSRVVMRSLLHGQIDAEVNVTGRMERPSLGGTLELSRMAWAGHDLGSGRIDCVAQPGGTRCEGKLIEGIELRGTAHRPERPEDGLTVALRSLALRPWLPPKAARFDPHVSGEISWHRTSKSSRAADHSGGEVRVSQLVVSAPGAQANANGTMQIDPRNFRSSPVTATVTARVAGSALTRAVSSSGGAGAADVDATVAGTIGAPQVRGRARFDGLTVRWPQSPFGTVRLDGPIAFADRTFTVGPLVAALQSGGRLTIGGQRGAGTVVLARPGASLPVSAVDLAVRASGIKTEQPVAGMAVSGLAMDINFSQPNATVLRAAGWVYLGRDFYELNKTKKSDEDKKPQESPPAAPSQKGPTLADHVSLQVRIVGPKDAVTVGVPHAPNVTVAPNCLIEGSLASPHLSGSVKGDGAYSRAALTIADWFTSRDLRACDLGPH